MIRIFAITGDAETDWFAAGWTRETAEENYHALASFCRHPCYRIVVTPSWIRRG